MNSIGYFAAFLAGITITLLLEELDSRFDLVERYRLWKWHRKWDKEHEEKEPRPLAEIFQSYPTDKYLNGYAPIYEELFEPIRDEVRELLEIGIFKGGSLQAWQEYFPKATIVGIDKELEFADKSFGPRIFGMWIDVTEPLQLAAAKSRIWDIIIDDGSHKEDEIQAAFDGLWPVLKPGGYYVIEDLGDQVALSYGIGEAASVDFKNNLCILKKRC